VLRLSRTVGIGAWVGVQCNLSFCDMELPWRRSVGYLCFVI
jgi:hypothetical protein